MSYYRRYSRPETIPASPELEARIERVGGELKSHLTDWEQGFIESITEAYGKYKGLTAGQHRTFEKIEKKYNPEAIAAKAAWNEGFTEEKRATLKLVADYYRTTEYFSRLVAKIDHDPDFVPCEAVWKKFVENKYAQKMLAAKQRESNFASGGFALLRDTFSPSNRGFWEKVRGTVPRAKKDRKSRTVLVLQESERLSTDRVWRCAFIDNPVTTFEVEERWLKKWRSKR